MNIAFQDLRCEYCHEELSEHPDVESGDCPACGARHHIPCWQEYGGCALHECRYNPKDQRWPTSVLVNVQSYYSEEEIETIQQLNALLIKIKTDHTHENEFQLIDLYIGHESLISDRAGLEKSDRELIIALVQKGLQEFKASLHKASRNNDDMAILDLATRYHRFIERGLLGKTELENLHEASERAKVIQQLKHSLEKGDNHQLINLFEANRERIFSSRSFICSNMLGLIQTAYQEEGRKQFDKALRGNDPLELVKTGKKLIRSGAEISDHEVRILSTAEMDLEWLNEVNMAIKENRYFRVRGLWKLKGESLKKYLSQEIIEQINAAIRISNLLLDFETAMTRNDVPAMMDAYSHLNQSNVPLGQEVSVVCEGIKNDYNNFKQLENSLSKSSFPDNISILNKLPVEWLEKLLPGKLQEINRKMKAVEAETDLLEAWNKNDYQGFINRYNSALESGIALDIEYKKKLHHAEHFLSLEAISQV